MQQVMPQLRVGKPATSTDDWIGQLVNFAKDSAPSLFALKAPLPTQGRQDFPLAATDKLNIVLKTYASGGENGLHAHINEDHAFIVLQGRAKFYGKGAGKGPQHIATLEKFQGIMVPKGALYCFEAVEGEPLVMLRVGTVDISKDPVAAFARVGEDGRDMDSYSAENKQEPVRYDRELWFPG